MCNVFNVFVCKQSHGLDSDVSYTDDSMSGQAADSQASTSSSKTDSSQSVLKKLIRELKKASLSSHHTKRYQTSGSESSRSSSAVVEQQVNNFPFTMIFVSVSSRFINSTILQAFYIPHFSLFVYGFADVFPREDTSGAYKSYYRVYRSE